MIIRAAAIALLASISLAAQVQDSKVYKLAKEGYIGEPKTWSKHNALIGKPMPKLDLSGWVNGQLSNEDMKGKIVIIDFWATWCGSCIVWIPHNNKMAEKYADQGVLILGVCGGRGQGKMDKVVKQFDLVFAYPNAHPTTATERAWQVSFFPTYAVVDRDGMVRAIGIKPSYVEKVVDALLEEQPK